MKKNKFLGNIIMFATALVWGGSFVFQHESAQVTPPYTYNASRILLAAIALWAVVLFMEKTDIGGYAPAKHPEKQSADLWKGGIICGIFLTGGTTLQQIGIGLTSAGKSGFLTALYTVLVPVLGKIFFHTKLSLRRICGVGIAMVGLYLLSVTEAMTVESCDVILILGAVCFALQMLFVEKYIGMNNPIKLSAIQFTVCAVIDWILALLFEQPGWDVIAPSIGSMLYVGLASGALGYTLQIIGERLTDASIAALIGSLESVFAAIFGWLILREVMSPRELAGAALMFAAVILVQLPRKNRA